MTDKEIKATAKMLERLREKRRRLDVTISMLEEECPECPPPGNTPPPPPPPPPDGP